MRYIGRKFQVHILENAKVCHRVLFLRRFELKEGDNRDQIEYYSQYNGIDG